MTKVLILNTIRLTNKGNMGRIEGMISCLESVIPQSKITIMHSYYKQDKNSIVKQLLKKYPNLEVKEHPWFKAGKSKIMMITSSLVSFSYLLIRYILNKLRLSKKEFLHEYDAVVELNFRGPDGLFNKPQLGPILGNLFPLINIWYAKIFGKPVIVSSAGIGPYHCGILRRLAKYVFNKVDIITLREDYSLDYLKKLGVNRPRVYLAADLAFLMNPVNTKEITTILEKINIAPEDKPLVGITPATTLHPSLKLPHYTHLIAELSDYLIEDFNATIIYIIHTKQDMKIGPNIYQKVKNKQKVRILPANLSASETKGIIGMCDLFICWRFHALVASTSMAVPSLGVCVYNRNKFHGILGKMMEQENYLIYLDENFEYDDFFAEIKSKVTDLWMNKDLIAKDLKERVKIARKQALINGKLVKELIQSLLPLK